ncbi:hypothetical protein F1B92_04930 [Campylobacter sp. FMV-PI01]|uniref:Uncharacterized protein n=1 Tax=Campylobacter portucalensis TaxID=2608384 RepID=A0A6L5WJU4_9BACT|nr:hypothetical protein [Campylobacter portucalensis]MSN96517.1 hypothetical protein [Campylobacter portucalensis]
MRYIIFLCFLIFIIVLFTIDDKKINKKMKISVVFLLSLISIFAYFYEINFQKSSQNIKELSNSFLQGKNLKCKGIDVNLTNFEFSYATSSFIAKNGVPKEFKNLIFEVSKCELKDK